MGRAESESGCRVGTPARTGRRRATGLPARSCAPVLQRPEFDRTFGRGSPAPCPALGPAPQACAENGAGCYATSTPRGRLQHRASQLAGQGCKRAGPGLSCTSRVGPIWTQVLRPNLLWAPKGCALHPCAHAAPPVCDWFPRSANTQQPQKLRRRMASYHLFFLLSPPAFPRMLPRLHQAHRQAGFFPRWHPRPPPQRPSRPT